MGKLRKKCNEEQKKTFVVAQDIKLVKALAGNDKKLRDRVLKNLKKWFNHRSSNMPFTKEDFMRVWKGLFYTMWMSDKPLVQEECAEKIATLVHFPQPESSLLFLKCGLTVLATEWFGIDQLRLDKFLMFTRRLLRQGFEVLKRNEWKLELITEFGDVLLETVLKEDSSTHLGLTMHITEIYLEELAKVSNGEIETHLVAEFIKPFVKQLSVLTDNRQIVHMRKFMFHHLLHQSDEGVEYQVMFEAWKERGFPGGTIDSMQRIDAINGENVSDEEELEDEYKLEGKTLDPRAGQVDVLLPQLQFNASEISQLLLNHKFTLGSTTKARKVISKLAEDFEKLSEGMFPLGMKEIRLPENDGYSTTLKKSVNRLVKLDKKLLANSNKNRKRKMQNAAKTLKKSKTVTDSNSMAGIFADKLREFIERSEGNLTNGVASTKKEKKNPRKVKPLKSKTSDVPLECNLLNDWAFEQSFRRNSGMWVVHRQENLDEMQTGESTNSDGSDLFKHNEENSSVTEFRKNSKDVTFTEEIIENGTDRLTDIIINKKSNASIFPQNERAKEGEVEIFVLPDKFKKKTAKQSGKNVSDVLNDSINSLAKTKRYSLSNVSDAVNKRTNKRYSLDAKLVKNPFSKSTATLKSEKKVKIVLKLNQSQEIHEHRAQLKSSPAIPYDANKRPLKPLLKPNAVGSPINPFYKKKLKS